jgi:hypothetical protein
VDGIMLAAGTSRIELLDDGATHRVHMTLG